MIMLLTRVLRILILIFAGSILTKLGSLRLCFTGASSSSSSSSDICTTPKCIETGRQMAASMNTSVDPCSDFFAYSCGGWIQSNPIPDEKSGLTVNELVVDRTMKAMKTAFEEGISKSSSSSEAAQQAKSVRIVLDLYRECMDMATRDRRGLTPLKKLLKNILGSDWPAVNESTLVKGRLDLQNSKEGLLWAMAQAASILPSAHLPFISLYINKNPNGTLARIIHFDPPTFGLTANAFSNSKGSYYSEVDIYRRRIKKLAKLLFFSSSSRSFSNSSTFEAMLESRSKEVFTLEQALAKATLILAKERDTRNASFGDHRKTLEEFTSQSSTGPGRETLNFTTYLNELATLYHLPYRFNRSDTIIVGNVGYFEKLASILSTTPPLVLHNYLGYKLAWHWKDATDNRARYIRLWHRNRAWGITRMRPLWKDCLQSVTDTGVGGEWAASRLYVDRFVAPETRRQASEMVDDLRKAFSEQILKGNNNNNNTAWLDEPTQRKALEKAARMRFIVAYPDWLLNNTALDQIKFGFTRKAEEEADHLMKAVKRGYFFESAVEASRQQAAIPLRDLHLTPDVVRDFPVYKPVSVGALASLKYNAVAITAGQLQPPFFDPTVPAALNYGAVGAIIGHEISHHFDDEGAQYDLNGNLIKWWSANASVRFEQKTRCFVNQYESIVDRVTGDSLRGTLTLGENISDNVGLLAATLALEDRLKKEGNKGQRLPMMEHFSPQQLFFLSFAQKNCEHLRLKLRKVILDRWSHLPNEYRVNVPLRNLKHFSEAFSCPRGSAMNPNYKCRLFGDDN